MIIEADSNAKAYNKHSFSGNERVFDVGCVNGVITSRLLRLMHKGNIVGMIHFGK